MRALACSAGPAKSVLTLSECKSLGLFFILALCLSFPQLVEETSVSSVSSLEKAEDTQEIKAKGPSAEISALPLALKTCSLLRVLIVSCLISRSLWVYGS